MNYAEIFKMAFAFGLVVFVATIACGAAMAIINKTPVWCETAREYFGSPVNGKLELNWTLRQFFLLFSKGMSKRWYEARAHIHAGFWLSLGCTLGLVTLVRFDFMYEDDDSRGTSEGLCYGFWVLPGDHKKRIKELLVEAEKLGVELSKKDHSLYPYQIFIAGENVVWDYMNGGM